MAKPGRGSDQFPLRLPPGLRDRIKAYAARQGRSMNEEIVRLLEREFPEPATVEEKLGDLLVVLGYLAGPADGETPELILDQFTSGLLETLSGIEEGRFQTNNRTQQIVATALARWREDQAENEAAKYTANMDDDEADRFERTGSTAKFVDPFPDDDK